MGNMEKAHECCATCRRRYDLMKFDYSQDGCIHTDMEGYICTAFADEGKMVWMVGEDENTGMCECWEPKIRLRGVRAQ